MLSVEYTVTKDIYLIINELMLEHIDDVLCLEFIEGKHCRICLTYQPLIFSDKIPTH